MRSAVISTGGSSPTELALAMRKSSLVVKRVEGMRDGVRCKDRHLMCYNYRRREEAPYIGAKVFMDAHEPVTLEEGDRYPLAPPDFAALADVVIAPV